MTLLKREREREHSCPAKVEKSVSWLLIFGPRRRESEEIVETRERMLTSIYGERKKDRERLIWE